MPRPPHRKPPRPRPHPEPDAPEPRLLELEYLPGLEPFVRRELKRVGVQDLEIVAEDALRFAYQHDPARLFGLRRAVALFEVLEFMVPRPKALLGDQQFRRLLEALARLRARHPEGAFRSFRFAAAGKESSVFQRLADALARSSGLEHDPEVGDLLLRVKPGARGGWEVLLRLTPRPLSARAWRVCNLPGGLNATLAVAMNDLVAPTASERYLNAMCGSGTLLVEQALAAPPAQLMGVDLSEAALDCARENLRAAQQGERVTLLRADAVALPFADASFDAITADLPWGDAVGSHEANARLYPVFLQEAARVGTQAARLALLTHEVKLFQRLLAAQSAWRVRAEHRVFHGGHYPRLYRLERAAR